MRKSLLHCSILLASASLFGCGPGDEPYDTVAKDPNMISSSDIEQNVKADDGTSHARRYLFLRTIRKAPRYFASIGSNQWYNDTKLVTLKRSENGIEVLQEDKAAIGEGQEYSPFDNAENLRPLLTINGSYIDYKCATDSYDKCTNQEQVNNDADVEWDQKKYFVPDLNNLTVKDIGFNDVSMNSCLSKVGAPRVVHRTEQTANGKTVSWNGHEIDLKNGVINLEIAQDYQASMSASCESFSPQDSIDNYSLTVTSFVSIVALDSPQESDDNQPATLVSKNYKPIPYAHQESIKYGFFATDIEHLDTFNRGNRDGQFRQYLQRWNPKKTKLHYYLSNDFYEAKNAPYLAAATQSIALINAENSVFKTGVPQIELAPAGNRQSGDLRYTIIELADEPLANGLLGYAPSATNPLTGEIVSGVVNQYSGNAINVVPTYWQEIRRAFNHGKISKSQLDSKVNHTASYLSSSHAITTNQAKNIVNPVTGSNSMYGNKLDHFAKILSGGFETLSPSQVTDLAEHKTDNDIYEQRENGETVSLETLAKQQQDEMYNLSRNNMLSTKALTNTIYGNGDYRTLPQGVHELPGQKANKYRIDWSKDSYFTDATHKRMKNFGDLSVADQQDLKVKLSAAIFASTLTHEMGHSLGLRHNFMGSVDAENYNFDSTQIAKLKTKLSSMGYPNIEPNSNSSSRMEYSLDAYTSGYGPYDIAALRFGYARQIQLTKDGKAILSSGKNTDLSDVSIVDNNYVSLKKRDEERRAEIADLQGRGEGQGKYSRGVADKTVLGLTKTFKFCTDEDTYLGNTCNRFDAGFTSAQITHNKAFDIDDRFIETNTRNDRENFGMSYLTYYTLYRLRQFDALHAFIDDSHDFVMGSGEDGLLLENQKLFNHIINECKTQDPVTGEYDVKDIPFTLSQYNNNLKAVGIICDWIAGTENSRDYLLHTAMAPLGRYITYNYVVPPSSLFSQNLPLKVVKEEYVSKNGPLNLAQGEVLLDSDSHQQLLRDMAQNAIDVLSPGASLLDEKQKVTLTDGSVITGKVTLTGHPLNSLQADNADPNHGYTSDRDVLGSWPDKLLAVRELLSRSTSRLTDLSTTGALADDAFAGEILKLGLCRQALAGTYSITQTSDENLLNCLPVLNGDLFSNGKFADADAQTAFLTNYTAQNIVYNAFSDWADTDIETLPTYTYAVAQYFNLPMKGKVNILRAMLNQFVLGSSTNNTGVNLQSVTKSYREYASVYTEEASYAYQKPIVFDFNNMSDIPAMKANLDFLLARDPKGQDMIVRMIGAKEDFVVKEDNRLALVLIKAYIKSLVDASNASSNPTLQASLDKKVERLANIINTLPRTDEYAELDRTAYLADL